MDNMEQYTNGNTKHLVMEDAFEGEPEAYDEDSDEAIDLYSPVDFDDVGEVLKRIFAVVERYPTGGGTAWWTFLTDWDRRFVLNIYDVFVTTGKAPLSPKQIQKAKIILRKMMTPASGGTGHF